MQLELEPEINLEAEFETIIETEGARWGDGGGEGRRAEAQSRSAGHRVGREGWDEGTGVGGRCLE